MPCYHAPCHLPAALKAQPELSRHLALVALAFLALMGLLVSVFLVRSPIHKEGSCVEADFVLFPSLIGYVRDPDLVDYMSQGNAELAKRVYQHFIRGIMPDPEVPFTFNPSSLVASMAVVALQARTGTVHSVGMKRGELKWICL